MKELNLILKRIYFAPSYTIGKLSIETNLFCDTLEDNNKDLDHDGKLELPKVMHETCIPFGRYEVIMTMSSRFKQVMPLLLNVPGFEGIRIHSGNTAEDTSGCILVGTNTEKGKVTGSRIKAAELYKYIEDALKIGKVFITIK